MPQASRLHNNARVLRLKKVLNAMMPIAFKIAKAQVLSRYLHTPRLSSTGVRKGRKFASYFYDSWRQCAGVGIREAKRKGSFETFSLVEKYFSILDNLLDNAETPEGRIDWKAAEKHPTVPPPS